ncbi:hypothetical protein BDK51DRAFT_32851 [Blyttiomyces helicus]|uniref:Uncharacterized protein n=1 Tax=Blyttiomyces helicus TaxID=388810 RepID=A0A4P9W8N2_9FUNG|nr:hypothetical protein BDK51DRAFT_32851 [Blyttiomyces helicus]|eukprot:RKO87823.1 hypothetical protein BDK51DRAFT_32851 [Blyttiomyces helicus]
MLFKIKWALSMLAVIPLATSVLSAPVDVPEKETDLDQLVQPEMGSDRESLEPCQASLRPETPPRKRTWDLSAIHLTCLSVFHQQKTRTADSPLPSDVVCRCTSWTPSDFKRRASKYLEDPTPRPPEPPTNRAHLHTRSNPTLIMDFKWGLSVLSAPADAAEKRKVYKVIHGKCIITSGLKAGNESKQYLIARAATVGGIGKMRYKGEKAAMCLADGVEKEKVFKGEIHAAP